MITHKVAPLDLEEEERLVALAQAGGHAALARLLEVHYQQMYHLALKVTRDPVKAQDVTQEASLQVLRRIDQFRGESRLSSWLSRIVVNTALLRHRREKRLVPTPDIYPPLLKSNDPDPDDMARDRQLLEMADKMLSELRDGDRELFIRRFVDGLSLNSISEETGLSLPALKSRFHRARLRLKEASEEAGWGFAL
jgi:RNA polymerase sigma-70 factor (ECF subfamily)